MTFEEELYAQIKTSLEGDATLITFCPSGETVPEVDYWQAEANENYPYYNYRLEDLESREFPVYTAKLYIEIWFYHDDASKAIRAEKAINKLFNLKTVKGTVDLLNCRIWQCVGERKETQKKDNAHDKDVIFIETSFDCRIIARNPISAL